MENNNITVEENGKWRRVVVGRTGQDTAHVPAAQRRANGARELPAAVRHDQQPPGGGLRGEQGRVRAGERSQSVVRHGLRDVLQRGRRDGARLVRHGRRVVARLLRDVRQAAQAHTTLLDLVSLQFLFLHRFIQIQHKND